MASLQSDKAYRMIFSMVRKFLFNPFRVENSLCLSIRGLHPRPLIFKSFRLAKKNDPERIEYQWPRMQSGVKGMSEFPTLKGLNKNLPLSIFFIEFNFTVIE